ncbi:unnamed protein product [Urochloa humidicola]
MSAEELKLKAAALVDATICGGVHDAPGREIDLGTIDLARCAVDAHNKNASSQLEFEKLVKVREQLVVGVLHYFTIKAKDGEATKLYEAQVYECPLEDIMELKDFKPVDC